MQRGHDGHTLALFVARHMQVGSRHHSGGSENKRGDKSVAGLERSINNGNYV